MGKRIISRARGKGGPRYRAPSHRFAGKISYPQKGKAKIIDIIHDPARSAPLAKLKLEDGSEKLIIAAAGVKVGDTIEIGSTERGNIAPLAKIPKGSFIFGMETFPRSGPKICCSAGVSALLISHQPDSVIVQLPSKEFKKFHPNCLATIGAPACSGRKEKLYVKAGQKFYAMQARNKLWPRSSAVKMNPVDHPFGGHTKPGWPKSVARGAPPGQKVGSLASRRTGKRKK